MIYSQRNTCSLQGAVYSAYKHTECATRPRKRILLYIQNIWTQAGQEVTPRRSLVKHDSQIRWYRYYSVSRACGSRALHRVAHVWRRPRTRASSSILRYRDIQAYLRPFTAHSSDTRRDYYENETLFADKDVARALNLAAIFVYIRINKARVKNFVQMRLFKAYGLLLLE